MMKPAVTMKKLLALYTAVLKYTLQASFLLQWQRGISMQRFLFQYLCIDMPYTSCFSG